jgi:hypothetical protein
VLFRSRFLTHAAELGDRAEHAEGIWASSFGGNAGKGQEIDRAT